MYNRSSLIWYYNQYSSFAVQPHQKYDAWCWEMSDRPLCDSGPQSRCSSQIVLMGQRLTGVSTLIDPRITSKLGMFTNLLDGIMGLRALDHSQDDLISSMNTQLLLLSIVLVQSHVTIRQTILNHSLVVLWGQSVNDHHLVEQDVVASLNFTLLLELSENLLPLESQIGTVSGLFIVDGCLHLSQTLLVKLMLLYINQAYPLVHLRSDQIWKHVPFH